MLKNSKLSQKLICQSRISMGCNSAPLKLTTIWYYRWVLLSQCTKCRASSMPVRTVVLCTSTSENSRPDWHFIGVPLLPEGKSCNALLVPKVNGAWMEKLMHFWRPGINSASWYYCLPIWIYHWLWDWDCTAVACEVVCCMEVRAGL